jgi:hypothetical protein
VALTGVGKSPGKEPAGGCWGDVQQALWGFDDIRRVHGCAWVFGSESIAARVAYDFVDFARIKDGLSEATALESAS